MTYGERKTRLLVNSVLVAWLLLFGTRVTVSFAQDASVPVPLTAAQVVEKMVAMNAYRAEALQGYRATRIYHLEYHGLSSKTADLVVAMTYRRPDQKEFTTLSETGSELLHKRVLQHLLQAEVEAMQEENRRQTAIRPENYEFRLAAYERTPEHDFYVLEISPRIKNKFLFRGRIWVEGRDFAIARMEGEPAKNPSWWTKRNVIQVTYQKLGNFWLPARNETNTQLRLLGRSLLTIDYQDYKLLEARGGQLTLPSGEPSAAGSQSPR
jgi:hypothetical protein